MARRAVFALFFLVLLVSCGPAETIQPSPLPIVTLAVVPTASPAVLPPSRPVPTVQPSPTAVPSPTVETVLPPTGLIYRTDGGSGEQ